MTTKPPRAALQRRERTLRRAYELAAAPDLSFAEKVDEMFDLVTEMLDVDYATLSRVHPASETYIFERVATPPSVDLEDGDHASLSDLPNCARVAERRERLVLSNVPEQAPALADPAWGIACYLGVPVVLDGDGYGTFCFYDMDPRSEPFSDWEATFVELLGRWASYELQRQRDCDRRVAVNELNATIRDIARAVSSQPTRADVESVACEALARSESYVAAWVCEPEPAHDAERVDGSTLEDARDGQQIESAPSHQPNETDRAQPPSSDDAAIRANEDSADAVEDPLTVRAVAGLEAAGGERARAVGPEAAQPAIHDAIRTGDVQTRHRVAVEPPQTRSIANDEPEFISIAAVPIIQDDIVYAALTVCAARPRAFGSEAVETLAYLGDLIDHASRAAQRRQVMVSDAMVELTIRLQGAVRARGISDPPSEPVLFHKFVELSGGRVVAHGTTNASVGDTLQSFCDHLETCEELSVSESVDGTISFEVELTEVPLLTTVASMGGRVEEILVDGPDLQTKVYVPLGVDARRVLDGIEERYPNAELLVKRETTYPDDVGGIKQTFATKLTDRQLDVLRAVYYEGYFNQPRGPTGEEIADQLDISLSTLTQHLNAAQHKVFETIFEPRG